MIATQTNLQNLRTGFQTQFQAGIGLAAKASEALVTTVTSTTKIETYGFMGDLPIFRKWVGEKQVKSLEEKSYQLINDDYEVTVGLHKNKIADDNLGLYGPMIAGWGQEAGALKDRLVFDALKNGHTSLCYDGQYFFDTDHVINGVTFANSNADTTVEAWFLLDLSKPLKPIIYQDRQAPRFTMITDPQDSHVFRTGEYLMGGEARGGAGYTFWQLAYRSRKTLNSTNYELAKQAMASITDDNGEPAGIKPTHIVVGASNLAAAKNLFKKMTLANGEGNIYDGELIIIEAPRLP